MFFMISIYYFDFPRGLELIIFMHMYAWFAWLHAWIRGCVRPCVLWCERVDKLVKHLTEIFGEQRPVLILNTMTISSFTYCRLIWLFCCRRHNNNNNNNNDQFLYSWLVHS